MATLLLAEHDNKTLKDATRKALTAATALGGEVQRAGRRAGMPRRRRSRRQACGCEQGSAGRRRHYDHMLAEPVAALVVSLAPSYAAVIAAATTSGKNIMPRVASPARRHAGVRHHQGDRARYL